MIRDQIIDIINSYCDIPFNQDAVTLVPPPNSAHGDLACNALLIAAKALGVKHAEATQSVRTQLGQDEDIIKVDIVGPGFINIFFRPTYWQKQLKSVLALGDQFGRVQIEKTGFPGVTDSSTSCVESVSSEGQEKKLNPGSAASRHASAGVAGGLVRKANKVNIEFVSTNPTGPLHVGHGRSAVLGDALARLLEATGHDVTKEYYINDAGNQVNHLARSVYLRYLEALGETITPDQFTADMYGGDYLIPLGQHIVKIDGDKWRKSKPSGFPGVTDSSTKCIESVRTGIHETENKSIGPRYQQALSATAQELVTPGEPDGTLAYFKKLSVDFLMDAIKTDLKLLNIDFDVFTSEQQLIEEKRVQQAIDHLGELGHLYTGALEKPEGHDDDTYEARQQLLFKATDFGDDKDRALMKSDDTWTYFASDIAYHFDKYKRGFDTCINVWGADHIGYVQRLKAATKAVANKDLEIIVAQMVNFLEDGKPYRMSKRSGMFVTLRDVVEDIGADAFRFMLLSRQQDSKYDFDFHVVREHSKDNLVFYVQYAYARVCSVKRRFEEVFPGKNFLTEYLEYLTWDTEFSIIKLMDDFPRHVLLAAKHREPHRLVNYLYDLACAFHTLWSEGRAKEYRFIEPDQFELTSARLCLLDAIGITIKNGMTMLGVSVKEQM